MTFFFPLSVLRSVGILVKLYAIRSCRLLFSGWTLDRVFPAPELDFRFVDEKENGSCHRLLMSYACYPFPSFPQFFQNVTVDWCYIDWRQWNKGWRIILWYSCCWTCCNILDAVFCDMCDVIQWEYKFFTALWEMHRVIVKHWTPYGVTFWQALLYYFWETIGSTSKSLGFLVSESK